MKEAEWGEWPGFTISLARDRDSGNITQTARRPEVYRLLGARSSRPTQVSAPVLPLPEKVIPLSRRKTPAGRSNPVWARNAVNASIFMLPANALVDLPGSLVPLVGEIAAGAADCNIAYHDTLDYQEQLTLPADLVKPSCYALRVRGTSMIGLDIEPGDYVVVQPQQHADDGDLVVACLADSLDPEGYVTLKRLYRRGDHTLLQPANEQMGPIRIFPRHNNLAFGDRDGVRVQGKVIAIVKNNL